MPFNDVAKRVRSFLQQNFLYARPDFRLEDDASLIDGGVLDSMGVVELVEFLETEFSVSIDGHEITEENLGTLRAICRLVRCKLLDEPSNDLPDALIA